ncbi:MAG: glycoside hydrolase family 3 N-terminal domain-containing protein [Salinivirgaceae bacterium]
MKLLPAYNRSLFFFASVILLLTSCAKPVSDNEDEIIYQKADSVLNLMTLEEKVGQMLNIGLPALLQGPFYSSRDSLIFDPAKVHKLLVEYKAGSVQNLGTFPLTPAQWRYYIAFLQEVSKTQTRLRIPILYGIDAVHGANYTAGSVMFPHQINLAATFEPEYAKKVAEITAYELKASAIPWNYAPVLDVARNAMWGRMFESFGEDTYLTTQMGLATMEGMQDNNPGNETKVVACAKHFVGYGASYNGKDRSPVWLPENNMRQVLLPPFQEAIKMGLLSLMVSSGAMNGIPSHIDYQLITKLLKEELGFKGLVISDWNDIDNLHSVHRVAADEREAVQMSVMAGVDMCMEPYDESFAVHLIDLVKAGEVPMSRINDAVRRILYVKFKSGIFDNPLFDKIDYNEFASQKSDSINRQIAAESIVLLKNENNLLPLSKHSRILVTGVAANSLTYLNGAWSRTWSGQDTSFNDVGKLTILQALVQSLGKNRVSYAKGSGYTDGDYISEAVALAKNAETIVVCVGENPATEKPSDIDELDLPLIQQQLVKELAKTGKPIILVLVQGRPRIIRNIEPLAESILMAFLPGNEGGLAVSDVLTGQVNPSGKLPYTYPRYSGSVWTYDHLRSDERDANFGMNGFTPQYEFGFGLSYTNFEYSNLVLSKDTLAITDSLKVSVTLTNKGTIEGKETIMLFVSDEVASISQPVKRLRRFQKINLYPGNSQTINFTLGAQDLQFVNQSNKWVNEPGFFTLTVGNQNARFYLSK